MNEELQVGDLIEFHWSPWLLVGEVLGFCSDQRDHVGPKPNSWVCLAVPKGYGMTWYGREHWTEDRLKKLQFDSWCTLAGTVRKI